MSKWPAVVFQDAIADVTGGNNKLPTNEYLAVGVLPVIDQGREFIAGYTNNLGLACKSGGELILFGDHTKILKFVDFPFALGADGVKVLKCKDGFFPKFVFHCLKSVKLPENVGYSRHFKFLKEVSIPCPPIEEQKRIAAILDKADSIFCMRQQAIQLVDDFLRATFLEMFGDPELNPKGFERGTIRDVVASANYGTSEKAHEVQRKDRNDIPVLRMNNITYQGGWDFNSLKYVDWSLMTEEKYLVRKGDLLFNRTNSKELVGKTAVYELDEPMAFAGYLVRVRTNLRGNPYYLAGYLNSTYGKKILLAYAKSIVGMANINAQEMQDIPLLIAPIELQDRYASVVMETRRRLKKFELSILSIEQLQSVLSFRHFSPVCLKEHVAC